MIHSKAYASNEWAKTAPWSPPTSSTIAPGASATYGLRLLLAQDVEQVGSALLSAGSPVAVPLPGATINLDMRNARLDILLPAGLAYASASTEPAGCAVLSHSGHPEAPPPPRAVAAQGAWAVDRKGGARRVSLGVTPTTVGRCRIALNFTSVTSEGLAAPPALVQYVHYMVLEPASAILQRHGDFASTAGWLPANASDPWHRGPAFMGSDSSMGSGKGGALLEEPRVFMGGLSDESGASAPLAMAVKQLGLPVAREVEQLEEYVFGTLWAGAAGERNRFLQAKDYSVRSTMLYWSDSIDASPAGAAAKFAPGLYQHCHKCWATCSKKRGEGGGWRVEGGGWT